MAPTGKRVFTGAILALSLAWGLGACAPVDPASRAAPFEQVPAERVTRDYRIESFTVTVPRSLRVNEANTYYPRGDIVWRGDPRGDRHAQVKALFEAGLRRSAEAVRGSRPVRVDVLVTRFHGLSEKARYSVGGVHDISFRLRLVDSATGRPLGPVKEVQADLRALSGQAAMDADARGQTQKARIVDHLSRVFVEELTLPEGHRNAKLGLLQAINDL